MYRRNGGGYSLYELLMTLALVAIILSIGLPSFGSLAANQRLRAQVDPLFHAVHLARKTSIARRHVVTLCASRAGSGCDAGYDWSDGWLMFVNADRDSPPVLDPGERVLQRHRGDPRVRISGNRRAFTLRATELRATNGTLVFCDRAGRGANRALVISYTGRPRVAREDRSGAPYACPD